MLSPTGRWLAYVSDERGRDEVYVLSYPEPEAKQQISRDGGREPVWSRDGRELFYRNGDKMMVVDVETGPVFRAGTPRLLFEGRYRVSSGGLNQDYDVSPNGQRFVMVRASGESGPRKSVWCSTGSRS
jgi:Tol biopolymer transport system component